MRRASLAVVVSLLSWSVVLAQTGQKPAQPSTAKPSTAKPSTAKPSPAKPAAAKPAPTPEPPAPPPPSDVRFKSRYVTGAQTTESATYLRGTRERYELGDMVLLRQHDLKRTIQISLGSKTYLVTPDPDEAPAASAGKPGGTVTVETSIADVGERKEAFGRQARRVVTVSDRQPQAGACDQTKSRIETDAWYIDAPNVMAAQPPPLARPGGACRDEVTVNLTGDAALLGFPVSYTTTLPGADGTPVVMQMDVTEFDITTLDEALFEIPAGMTEVRTARELARAMSDVNETTLASRAKASANCVGVPELENTTTQQVDTRALRTQLIAELREQKVEGVAMAAAPRADLDAHARDLGCGHLLVAQVTELKASKPGRLGRLMKTTAGENANQDITEAKVSLQLLPVGAAKAKVSTTSSGNDGGVGFRTGLRLARVAAMLYLRYASPMAALNTMQIMDLGGMGFLNNPMLMQMQSGPGLLGTGRNLDRTAGAAMFLLDAMAAGAGGASEGPSFDASLAEALEDAAKKAGEGLRR